ncbi:acyltransferase family protein [Acidipila sp. EB88]|uniref:acyltransferase family protein n=1 Tax=Acidipila sp. EB88 TaxID=2305226 RepID=UPI000F5F1A4C|nr:heparan-alpha-glucosaminide N-acetyltransferase domain-containing protein [Acidipila sp. EB88]RRA49123.1 DUF1624 domain-containing protein [Acidipila sp. EB88]
MSTITVPATTGQRLLSIDVLRGVTVGFMILVNNNGNNDLAYRALNHSPWNGFTPTDLVFPTFLFIMGISLVLSSGARIERSGGRDRTGITVSHTLRRFALLVFFGLVVNGFPYFHLSTLRVYGVLQRIAVCYLLASLLLVLTRRASAFVVVTVALLVGYWVLLRWMPVPGHGLPVRDFPLLDRDINLCAWIDRHVFPHRLFEGTRDPEGLLSDLPSLASTLLGVLTGLWLRVARSQQAKALGMAAVSIVLLLAGQAWNLSFPINKKLWTSSYALYAGGWSLLLLAITYYLVEVRGVGKSNERSSLWPALALGTNAITAYVLSELLSSAVSVFHVNAQQSFQQWIYGRVFEPIVNPAFGSMAYSIVFVLVCWVPVWVLYRRKIFLKL